MREEALFRWISVAGARIIYGKDGTIKSIVLPREGETAVDAVEDSFHREQMLRALKELKTEPTK